MGLFRPTCLGGKEKWAPPLFTYCVLRAVQLGSWLRPGREGGEGGGGGGGGGAVMGHSPPYVRTYVAIVYAA